MEWVEPLSEDDVYEHVVCIHLSHPQPPRQNLGFVNKSKDVISIELPKSQIDLTITQSLSSLGSATESSTTGFVCWQVCSHFADWLLADEKCPYRKLVPGSAILELGTGVGAILPSTIGPTASKFVASDQKHILKLMKRNFAENVVSNRFTSSTLDGANRDSGSSQIEFIELDWEHLELGKSRLSEISASTSPDFILSCDTVYNENLVPLLVDALSLFMGQNTIALVALQLREEYVTTAFLEEVIRARLEVRPVPDYMLSNELIGGFMVYHITKEGKN